MAGGTTNTPQDTTVNTFFQVLTNTATGHSHNIGVDVPILMNQVFCADNPGNGVPCVAITEHGMAQGPGFFGAAEVTTLFTQLFTSLPDAALTPLSELRLYSPGGYTGPITIGVQTTLTGQFRQKWFHPASDPHYSPPLSNLNPAPHAPYKAISIPAFAVFTFDNPDMGHRELVSQLAIYMDRYHFVPQATLHASHLVNREIAALLERLSTAPPD